MSDMWQARHLLTAILRAARDDDGFRGFSESPVDAAESLAEGAKFLTGTIVPGLRPLICKGGGSTVWCCSRSKHAQRLMVVTYLPAMLCLEPVALRAHVMDDNPRMIVYASTEARDRTPGAAHSRQPAGTYVTEFGIWVQTGNKPHAGKSSIWRTQQSTLLRRTAMPSLHIDLPDAAIDAGAGLLLGQKALLVLQQPPAAHARSVSISLQCTISCSDQAICQAQSQACCTSWVWPSRRAYYHACQMKTTKRQQQNDCFRKSAMQELM